MKWLRWLLLIVALLMSAATLLAFNLLASTQLTERLRVIQPRVASLGANIVVFETGDSRIVVDSQLPALTALARLHIGSETADDHVIITHWHPDHSGGYAALAPNATSWAHANTRQRLARSQTGHDLTQPGSRHQFAARSPGQLPNRTVGGRQRLLGAEIVHVPNGHTDGDLVVFFSGDNVVAAGDLLWPGAFPFVDVHTGGTVSGLLAALDAIIAATDATTLIVPGHGAPITGAELWAYRKMIADSSHAIACAAEPSTAVAAWASWASALVTTARWVEIVRADAAVVCG